MKRLLFPLLILIPVILFGQLYLQEKPLDVPYVPSKPEVVAAMLRMAKITKGDVLYDLGCGDGRIVITAAQQYGVKGVGIDIDPERIRESKENAAKAGVEHLVRFIEQDLFKADFHEATVVSLYLLTSVNLRLRPNLLAQLRPGTRVVSHNYAMDTWKPDDSTIVVVNDTTHNVYLWIVPANVSGAWEGAWTDGSGKATPFHLELEQHFQWPSGKIKLGEKEMPLIEIRLSGDQFQFAAEAEDTTPSSRLSFSGKVTGNEMQGMVEVVGADGRTSQKSGKAKRSPLTMKPLDAGE
jgi:SAM-dependent methyltransferase